MRRVLKVPINPLKSGSPEYLVFSSFVLIWCDTLSEFSQRKSVSHSVQSPIDFYCGLQTLAVFSNKIENFNSKKMC